MILFDLKCSNRHVFEAWFRDSAAFDAQADAQDIACPVCGDTGVGKAPMAPRLSSGPRREPEERSSERKPDTPANAPQSLPPAAESFLRRLREEVERNSDNVGKRFPDEARKIHSGECEERSIYGEASPEEASDLREEGIPVVAIPWLPRKES